MSTADFQMEERCELIVSAYVLGKDMIIKTDGTCGLVGRIVRCKDCKHLYENKAFGCYECMRDNELYVRPKVEPDGFCKWGEKR